MTISNFVTLLTLVGLMAAQSTPDLETFFMDRDEDGRGPRPHTLSCEASPSGWNALYRIWYNMLGEKLFVAPELEVSIFEGKLYVMLYWKPQTSLHSMLRPECWHTTVGVAFFPLTCWRSLNSLQTSFAWWRNVRIMAVIERRIARMWSVLKEIRGPQESLEIIRPPWAKSFNFGGPEDLHQELTVVMVVFELLAKDFKLDLRKRRELHISWH